MTPELEALGANPDGVGTQCPRRWGVCDPASRKGCCEGQVGITVTLVFGERPSTLPYPKMSPNPSVTPTPQRPQPPGMTSSPPPIPLPLPLRPGDQSGCHCLFCKSQTPLCLMQRGLTQTAIRNASRLFCLVSLKVCGMRPPPPLLINSASSSCTPGACGWAAPLHGIPCHPTPVPRRMLLWESGRRLSSGHCSGEFKGLCNKTRVRRVQLRPVNDDQE